MERILNYLGIAGVVGGFVLIIVQGIDYLMKGAWVPHTVYGAAESIGFGDTLASYPVLMDYLDSCPLSLAIIITGTFFIWISSRMRNA